ncbi:DUF4163 domain-containing protein [Paenibacillus sp. HWE-109]|uniref:DUF4163 domain-containing protein n=1 Tax=Paenibacillus sp. HWE-109 TaxID=1306526 RepID=UPI001EE08E7E|nr:DUF4163 domain-containing protein [Paenibacillus sp. HWE-109]UKS26659.1 DUF4163 domain-containing protein [Paenibacillus sp. HWE-109]
MFKKISFLTLLILFCFLQSSCSTRISSEKNSGNSANLPSETLNGTTKPINPEPQQESPMPKNEVPIILENSAGGVKQAYLEIKKESYIDTKANVEIKFPQITNIKDTSKQQVINSLIREEAMQLLKQYKNGEVELSSLNIDYSIKLNREKMISIQYTGIANFKNAAHPYNVFFVTNINVNKGTVIKLFDIIHVDKKFMEFFQTGTFQSVSPIYQEGYLEKYSITELLETFKNANFYFTDEALGISLGVPYAMGDHAEFEIKYKNIKSSMKSVNEIWNGISDSVSSGSSNDAKVPLVYTNKKLGFQISIWGSEKEWNEWWDHGGKDQPVPFKKLAVVNGNVLVKENPTEAIYQGDIDAQVDSKEYDKMLLDVRSIISTFKELK